ncbi:MAG: hypothetical protein KF699_12100 [Phycisphaeraceae bacterium]|nr:hypothetical protein [Phycisphaeraceae bacterium]
MARKPTPAKAKKPKASPPTPVPATTTDHAIAGAGPGDPVSDALTRHEAQRKADEAKLLADPVFRAAAEHGKRWELAQRAAADAAAPFRAEVDKLIADHPHGYAPESETARRFDALKWAIQDAETKAYAAHGFQQTTAPKSPADLLARLKRVELNWWFDLQETANLPRPSELLWQDAEGLRKRDPFLPELPAKPDAGRERYAALIRWCEDCARARNESPADQAFGAARAFVEYLAMVAQRAREYRPSPDKPDAWQDVAFNFAEAFIAWFDLTHLLTPAVCTEARRVYPPGAASIKLRASNETAPVVPAMPASVVNGLAVYRRVTLGATPYPTVIEAVADELGVYFRNAVYTGRRHPLEPDLDRLIGEAKARATARQVAQGKPAEPMGWRADLDELRAKETRAVVRERLGVKTYGDGQDLMMREWTGQDRARGESALWLLRCDGINFADLRMQLVREAEAVIASANKPRAPTIDPELLQRLEAGIAAVHSIGSNFDAGMARVGRVIESLGTQDDNNGDAKPPALSAGVEAIDEHDAALLAFLNRNPSLRRKVSDVLPDKGPQDRKAVAKRLRKLADRTPPLVDYPKDGRSGVVILPAGSEALKRATAPTPR